VAARCRSKRARLSVMELAISVSEAELLDPPSAASALLFLARWSTRRAQRIAKEHLGSGQARNRPKNKRLRGSDEEDRT